MTLEIHGGSERKDRPEGGFYVREMPTSKPLDTGGLNPNCAQGGNVIVQHALSGNNQRLDPDGEHFVVDPLTGNPHADHEAQHRKLVVAGTLNSGGNDGGFRTEPGEHIVISETGQGFFNVRRLTPREAERLQGFPDNFTAVNDMSDSARYRMLGNAVAVPVAAWIGKRIVEVHNDQDRGSKTD